VERRRAGMLAAPRRRGTLACGRDATHRIGCEPLLYRADGLDRSRDRTSKVRIR
jgi:hypothetical protein